MSLLPIIRQVFIPLLSLMILVTGSGYFSTLLTLILHERHASHFIIGSLSASYYLGIVMGSIYVGRYILNAGAIRVYAASASFMAAIMLIHGLIENPYLWIFLRFCGGISMAGMFIVIESWVLTLASSQNRGQILALYMVAVYITNALGQMIFFIPLSQFLSSFCIASLLAAISVVPLSIANIKSPHFELHDKMGFKKLVKISPSALAGCLLAGMCLGAIYGFLPTYGAERGMDTTNISLLMGVTILGGTILQFPIGKASDFISRRTVMLGVCFTLIATSLLMHEIPNQYLWMFFLIAFLFGGCAFTLYPLSISHMCDLIAPTKVVEASQGLLIFYGAGAVAGPLIASLFIEQCGYQGLMIYLISICSIFILFMTWRRTQKAPPSLKDQQEFVIVPAPSGLILSELDPRAKK